MDSLNFWQFTKFRAFSFSRWNNTPRGPFFWCGKRSQVWFKYLNLFLSIGQRDFSLYYNYFSHISYSGNTSYTGWPYIIGFAEIIFSDFLFRVRFICVIFNVRVYTLIFVFRWILFLSEIYIPEQNTYHSVLTWAKWYFLMLGQNFV